MVMTTPGLTSSKKISMARRFFGKGDLEGEPCSPAFIRLNFKAVSGGHGVD